MAGMTDWFDLLLIADIQRREERCRYSRGIGMLVVIIQCGGISQVMPVEVELPATITWDSRDDWTSVLTRFVESRRTDFKPMSTTWWGWVLFGAGDWQTDSRCIMDEGRSCVDSRRPCVPMYLCNYAPFVLIHDLLAFDTLPHQFTLLTHHPSFHPHSCMSWTTIPCRWSLHPHHISKPQISNVHHIRIGRIITSIPIQLYLHRRYNLSRLATPIPFPVFIQLVEHKVSIFVPLLLSSLFHIS